MPIFGTEYEMIMERGIGIGHTLNLNPQRFEIPLNLLGQFGRLFIEGQEEHHRAKTFQEEYLASSKNTESNMTSGMYGDDSGYIRRRYATEILCNRICTAAGHEWPA